MQVEIGEDARGRRAAIKRAETSEEAARLRREADLLDVATHPALVEVLAFEDGPVPVLQTAFVGPSLVGGRPLEVDEIAGVVAAAASTLADLHEMGLVHGSVALDHVLLDDDGRPVLCSLGCGGLAGERPPAGADEGAALLDPAVDVFGLGVVLAALLVRANGRTRTSSGDALRRLADSAMAAVASERPGARALADAVHDAVPGARLPRNEAAPPAPGARAAATAAGPAGLRPLEAWRRSHIPSSRAVPSRRGLRVLGGSLAALAAGGAGFMVVGRGPSSTAAPASAVTSAVTTTAVLVTGAVTATTAAVTDTTAATATTTTTTAAVTATPAPPAAKGAAPPTGANALAPTSALSATGTVRPAVTAAGSRTDCPALPGPLSADIDGDGCAEAVRYVAGVVEAGGVRWAVGEAGDVVAIGDWSCTGTRSLAVLRPRTGEVFTFTGWATAGHDVQAPLLAQVPGGQTVRAADLDADGCNELVVERAAGVPAVLRAPRVGS